MSLTGRVLWVTNRLLRSLEFQVVRNSELWPPTDHLVPSAAENGPVVQVD